MENVAEKGNQTPMGFLPDEDLIIKGRELQQLLQAVDTTIADNVMMVIFPQKGVPMEETPPVPALNGEGSKWQGIQAKILKPIVERNIALGKGKTKEELKAIQNPEINPVVD